MKLYYCIMYTGSEEDVTIKRKRKVYVDTDLSGTDNESMFVSDDHHFLAVISFAHETFL